MLRVGLTGNLAAGKSTVAALFEKRGAHILASDAMDRDLMQPGQQVFQAIAEHFGPQVLLPGGSLDRTALARIAFAEGRVEELNAIVHPAVIARQAELARELQASEPGAVLIIESALIFESQHFSATRRFDRIILVTAPAADKVTRFIARTQLDESEARRRLALQIPDEAKLPHADYVIENNGSLAHLEQQVAILWPALQALAAG